MKMQGWLNARSAQLLSDLNKIPFTDDADDKKLALIMAAMRESSIEMFQRAAERSRKDIQKINNQNVQATIDEVNAVLNDAIQEDTQPEPKKQVKLTSTIVRRVDSY